MVASGEPLIGVLALQGDVSEHVAALAEVGARTLEVRTREHLAAVDGLVIPGGESTTVGLLLDKLGMMQPLRDRIHAGMPVYGTCTGLILMARELEQGVAAQPVLASMDIRVRRNAFGRQRESFEADVAIPALGEAPFPAVFIRAPEVAEAGPAVEVLGRREGRIVAVRQGPLLATAFHPELTRDRRIHGLFANMVRAAKSVPTAS